MLGPATRLVRHPVTSFDEIALAATPRGLVALFSDATGTWMQRLGPQQGPAGAGRAAARDQSAARRVSDRCAGGLAVHGGATLWLACSRPGETSTEARALAERAGAPSAEARALAEPAEDPSAEARALAEHDARPRSEGAGALAEATRGGLWLYELDAALAVRSARAIGAVGRDGRGVALAASREQLFVAWADGARGAPAVQLATLPLRAARTAEPALRTLSQPGRNGRQPALLFRAPHLHAVWSESQLAPGGETHTVVSARDAERPRALRTVRIPDPTPRLVADRRGLVLSFRDASAAGARPELFVARLSASLALAAPQRLGRANSEGAPALALCADTRAALAPLDHAGELYIAFHPLSPELRASEANHQYYASGREFVLAAASCDARGVRALLAERTQPAKPGAELLSVSFECREE